MPDAASASSVFNSVCTASRAAIFSAINESLEAFSFSLSASSASILTCACFCASIESCSMACNNIFLKLCNSLSSMAKREESNSLAFTFCSDSFTDSMSFRACISVSSFEFLIESFLASSLFSNSAASLSLFLSNSWS